MSRPRARSDGTNPVLSNRSRGAVSYSRARIPRDAATAGALSAPVSEFRIRRILERIEAELPCSISELAVEFNLSQSRLQHLFKQKTGVRLGRLLTEQRLQKAAVLLTHTSLRIKEIAAMVGYEHTSSFTRAFEQRFVQAPQAYRSGRRVPKC